MPNKENEKYLLYGNINGLIDFERNSSNIFRGENDEHLDKLLLWAPKQPGETQIGFMCPTNYLNGCRK